MTCVQTLNWCISQQEAHDEIFPNTVLPAKSDSDVMFCLQNYQGLIFNRSRFY